MRRLPLLIFLAALLLINSLSGAKPIQAASGGTIHLSVDAGFQGRFRANTWVPLLITVSNDGPDVSGSLRVVTGGSLGSQASSYSTPVDLPRQSNKQLFLYVVLNAYAQQVQVDLTTPDGAVMQSASASMTRTDVGDLIYAVLTESPTGAVDLTSAHGSGSAYQVDWRIENIPTIGQALYGLDALLLTDVDTGKLSTDQRSAIQGWVLGGGHLIVTGGPNWQKTRAGVDALLPIGAGSTLTLSTLGALSTFAGLPDNAPDRAALNGTVIVAQGQPQPDARVLVAQSGSPVLVRGLVGQGTVDYLTADPGLEPFRSWVNRAQVWANLLSTSSRKPGWADGIVNADEAARAANFIKGLRLPDIFQLAAFLAAYIALIGPINYIALRRLGRLEWAWITIPLIIVLASLTTYAVGTTLRGTQATLNRLSIVQVWPGNAQAQVDGVLGVLSPRRSIYNVTIENGLTLRTLVTSTNNVLDGSLSAPQIAEGLQYQAVDVPVDAGLSTAFVVGGAIPAPALSGSATLQLSNSAYHTVSGEVRNESLLTLTELFILVEGTAYNVGTLKPGERRTFTFTVIPLSQASPTSVNRAPGYATVGYQPYNTRTNINLAALLNNGYTGNNPVGATTMQQEFQRRFVFLSGMTDANDFGAGRGVDVFFAGWSGDSPVGVRVDAPFTTEDTTLYLVKLARQIQTAQPQVTLHPGDMQWTPIGTGAQRDYAPYDLFMGAGDEAAFRFNPLPALLLKSVSSVSINLHDNGSSTRPSVALWDWQAGQWVMLDLTQDGSISSATLVSSVDIARFVGVNNAVQIRIRAENGDVNLTQAEVTLGGTFGLPAAF